MGFLVSEAICSLVFLVHVPFSQSQNLGANVGTESPEFISDEEIMLQQDRINLRLASLNYQILGFFVILITIIGIIKMARRGSQAFHSGWFLYGKPPEDRICPPVHPPKHSPSTQAKLGLLRQIHNQTFLQNVPFMSQLTVGRASVSCLLLGFILILATLFNPVPDMNPRRYGFLAAANIPFLALFSMKNSPLALLGKGYEKLNFIHRFFGYMIILCSLVHGGLMIRFSSQGMISNKGAFYSGCFMGFMILLVILTSISPMRNRFYRLFYSVHVLGYLSIFAAGIYHEKSLRPYILSAILLHLTSSGWQVLKWKLLNATLTALPGKITKVEINGVKTGWKAGDHVRLRILSGFWPSIQSHPFTIACTSSRSGRETNSLVLYVKAVGSFTTMLYAKAVTVDGFNDIKRVSAGSFNQLKEHQVQLPSDICDSLQRKNLVTSPISHSDSAVGKVVKKYQTASRSNTLDLMASEGVQVQVHLEGPYGGIGWHGIDEFKDVLVVAGGSGISFLLAVVSELVSSAKLGGIVERALVVYAVRDWEVSKYFAEVLKDDIAEASSCGLELDVRFFVTQKVDQPMPLGDIKLRWQRPQIDVLFKEFLLDVKGCQGVGLGACGPPSLMADVRSALALVDLEVAKRVGGIKPHFEELGW